MRTAQGGPKMILVAYFFFLQSCRTEILTPLDGPKFFRCCSPGDSYAFIDEGLPAATSGGGCSTFQPLKFSTQKTQGPGQAFKGLKDDQGLIGNFFPTGGNLFGNFRIETLRRSATDAVTVNGP